MSVFEFNLPARTIVGANVINRLPEIIQDYGERVLIVAGDNMAGLGILKKIQNLAETKAYGVIVFDSVSPTSGAETVDEGVMLARESKANVVIGVGGANTLNIAKAIAFISGNEGYMSDYFAGRRGKKKKAAYIEIPTTHGIYYGLLDAFYILDSEEKIKREYRNKFNFADTLLVDPKLTLTLPNKYVVAIGMEILAQSFDAYISKAASTLTDSYTEKAMELVTQNLKQAILKEDDVDARHALCTAGLFATISMNTSRPGTVFSLAMPLSVQTSLYRGIACSLLLPHVMEFNLTASPNKYVKIARALGENVNDISVVEAAIKAVEAIRKISLGLNVPQRLKDFDISEECFDDIVRDARTYDFLNVLPRPASYDDLLNILMSAH